MNPGDKIFPAACTRRVAARSIAATLIGPPLCSRAAGLRQVGCLVTGRRPVDWETDSYGGFVKGMQELGYVEGRNVHLEWRFGEISNERLAGMASELVRLPVEVMIAGGTPAVAAAQRVTRTLPIVMTTVADPVGSGFIASLARPGGNITGMSNISHAVAGKYFEFVQSIGPRSQRVAAFVNPTNVAYLPSLERVQAAAAATGAAVVVFELTKPAQYASVFESLAQERITKAIVFPDSVFIQPGRELAQMASRYRVAVIAGFSGYAESGGLMSYSANFTEIYRGAAAYVDKILRGANPGLLPVQQPTAFELIVNRTALAQLGLELPKSLLTSADRIVD